MSEKQITADDKQPVATQQKDQQDKSKALNKKLEMIFQQVKTLYALQYTKTDKYPNQIIPHLYLGSVGAALSKDVLIELNIKYVLTAMDEMKHPFPDIITEYKIIRVKDSKNENILSFFDESNEFIHKAVSSNQNVLVHCFAGVSRSSTFIMAYLIKHCGKTLNEALSLTQSARPVVQPNQNFLTQLKKYEEEVLKDKQDSQSHTVSTENEVADKNQNQSEEQQQQEEKDQSENQQPTEVNNTDNSEGQNAQEENQQS